MAEALQRIITNRYGGRDLPVTLILPDGARVPLTTQPAVEVIARSWKGLRALASPALGSLARAYVHGDLDFTGSARRILGIVESMVGAVSHGRDRARTKWKLFLHQHRGNRRNIAHHYDVSNAFYRIWLDQRMVYSCAYFRDDADTLDAAQFQKLDHICRKLGWRRGERLLDIGCGWGGSSFHAAERYGVDATGITLSQNQFDPRDGGDQSARPRRTRVRRVARLSRAARGASSTTRSQAWGCSSTSACGSSPLLRQDLSRPEAGRDGAEHGSTHELARDRRPGQRIGEFVDEYVLSPAASSRRGEGASRA
jgi:cyclopropane-fatty-acyl-phospholipid synthase